MGKTAFIGQRLRALRNEKSQRLFAEELGLSLMGYQNYEQGKRVPPGPVLARIAEVCDVSVDWILTGQEAGTDRVREEPAPYLDDVTKKVLEMMKDMDKKGRADVLKYVEAQKLWREKKLKEGA